LRGGAGKVTGAHPEQRAYSQELAHEIEGAVATLPDVVRGVFMLREVEGPSTLEAAECLGLNEEIVKTRLHRARAHLRRSLAAWNRRVGVHRVPAPRAALRSCGEVGVRAPAGARGRRPDHPTQLTQVTKGCEVINP
jgi:hypothetical protein